MTTTSMTTRNGQRRASASRAARGTILRCLREWQLVLALAVICLALFAAIFAPLLAPHSPYSQQLVDSLMPPGSQGMRGRYLLGTDELGRDLFSRLLYGIRPMAIIAIISVSLAGAFGFVYGVIAGYVGGLTAQILMRVADVQLSVPPIILAVLLAVALSPGVKSVTIVIAVVTWPQYARVVRADTLRVRDMEYVRLARVAGLSNLRILRYHVVPNVLNSMTVLLTLNLATAIIFEAALSFLGLGVEPPRPDWGNILAEGVHYLPSWWMSVLAGSAITLVVLAVSTVGDRLRDFLDPRLTQEVRIGVRPS